MARPAHGQPAVEGQVRDHFDELLLGDAVVQGASEMRSQLVGAVEGDEGGDGDQAAIALQSSARAHTSPKSTSSGSSASPPRHP